MNTPKPLLKDTGRGLTIYYKEKYLYSKYNPEKSIERYINNIDWNESTIYIIPSPLLGYGLNEVKNLLPASSILLLIETDINLYELSDVPDLNLVSKGFDFLEIFNTIDFSKYRKCELLKLNGGYEINKNLYNRFYRVLLNQLKNYWRNRFTLTKMGQLWIKNTLINLQTLNNSLSLSKLKTNKPVFVLGAGESAESSLKLIKEHREHIYLLCVDTALEILLQSNIKPDAVLALEAQFYNLPDFYGSKNLDIDLIYDLSSYPGVLRTLTGKKFFTLTHFSESTLIQKIMNHGLITETLPPLGSVGITALYIALQMTDNNIFISGLDFSYTLGKTHSRGTPYHLTSLIDWYRTNTGYSIGNCLKRPLMNKTNKRGIQENSDSILFEYSMQAKELLYNNDRVFDLTVRGMDLGIPLISRDEFNNYINLSEEEELSSVSVSLDGNILLNNELKLLDNGILSLKDLIDNKCSLKQTQSVLMEIDYFYDHYPEQSPVLKLNEKNAERYYYTLMRYKRVLTGSM